MSRTHGGGLLEAAAAPAGATDAPRINPLSLLTRGGRHLVLADPGSGGSTLMKFLALAGSRSRFRKRFAAKPDARLPVLVTLRRYAAEVAKRRNLPLLDYVREVIQADFSLAGADTEFFEYYLESGQTILLFDGLDELPESELKQLVRDRIRSLAVTYPGNTVLVTSRIVGYEGPFRFDEKEFVHHRVTALRLREIEQFVEDGYRVRIENEHDRRDNVEDLIPVVRDKGHDATRELAKNPLLLTIIALVHRIDAVLPDERVVLYEKCTETLLNTWHTWKYRGTEARKPSKVERTNRRRMEAIARWMHGKAGESGMRVVVRADVLETLLAKHIQATEPADEQDADGLDRAADFLEFVRRRAGLLIEVGDKQYSFVHLTFQEYLTASELLTQAESGGIQVIWSEIQEQHHIAAWHEVIRLLVASLRAAETQKTGGAENGGRARWSSRFFVRTDYRRSSARRNRGCRGRSQAHRARPAPCRGSSSDALECGATLGDAPAMRGAKSPDASGDRSGVPGSRSNGRSRSGAPAWARSTRQPICCWWTLGFGSESSIPLPESPHFAT